MADFRYIENSWALDSTKNPVTDLNDQKKQFAYKLWKDDFISGRFREDGKQRELKQHQSDIYQLIGFYSVFQGVWFQGVTQLAQYTRCNASVIPILLSVLVSVATITGVHLILSKSYRLKESFFKDKLASKIRECRFTDMEKVGLDFDFNTIKLDTEQLRETSIYERELVKLHQTKIALLAFLITLSTFFAYLIRATLCDEFH